MEMNPLTRLLSSASPAADDRLGERIHVGHCRRNFRNALGHWFSVDFGLPWDAATGNEGDGSGLSQRRSIITS